MTTVAKGNYPNHPLFRIAPLLDRGVQHDPCTNVLVAKIRAGRYTTDLWDCNGLYLDYAERIGSPAYRQVAAIKSRYEMTPEQLRAYRDDPARKVEQARIAAEKKALAAEKKALAAERKAAREAAETKLAAQRRAEAEERARFAQEFAELQARRTAEQERRNRDWDWEEKNLQRGREARAILNGHWECASCLRAAQVKLDAGVYFLGCPTCGRNASAEHAVLLALVTRQAQPEPIKLFHMKQGRE